MTVPKKFNKQQHLEIARITKQLIMNDLKLMSAVNNTCSGFCFYLSQAAVKFTGVDKRIYFRAPDEFDEIFTYWRRVRYNLVGKLTGAYPFLWPRTRKGLMTRLKIINQVITDLENGLN